MPASWANAFAPTIALFGGTDTPTIDESVLLVGTSAWYAPGQAAAEMCEAILKDKKKILPCSVFLQGEYGIRDLFVGVPVKLGARGVEQIIEITLTPDIDLPEDFPEWRQKLLTDPQTSGGLLVACQPSAVAEVLRIFRQEGFGEAAVVGELSAGAPRLRVY